MGLGAKLTVGAGGAVFVALLFTNRQRFAIPLLGRLKIALFLRDSAQVVIGEGGVVFVALLFTNRQRFAIPLLGRLKIALFLRDSA